MAFGVYYTNQADVYKFDYSGTQQETTALNVTDPGYVYTGLDENGNYYFYSNSSDQLIKYDDTLTEQWSVSAGGTRYRYNDALDVGPNGIYIAYGVDDFLTAYSRTDGSQQWEISQSTWGISVKSNGNPVGCSRNGNVREHDSSDGSVVQSQDYSTVVTDTDVRSMVMLPDDSFVLGVRLGSGNVELVRGDFSGTVYWQTQPLSEGSFTIGDMKIMANGNLAIGGTSNYVIDISDGTVVWSDGNSSDYRLGIATHPDGFVYGITDSGYTKYDESGTVLDTVSVSSYQTDKDDIVAYPEKAGFIDEWATATTATATKVASSASMRSPSVTVTTSATASKESASVSMNQATAQKPLTVTTATKISGSASMRQTDVMAVRSISASKVGGSATMQTASVLTIQSTSATKSAATATMGSPSILTIEQAVASKVSGTGSMLSPDVGRVFEAAVSKASASASMATPSVYPYRYVHAVDNSNVHQLADADGSTNWSTSIPAAGYDVVVSQNGTVAVVDEGPNVSCYDQQGNQLWSESVPYSWSTAVTHACIDIDSNDNVYAIFNFSNDVRAMKWDDTGTQQFDVGLSTNNAGVEQIYADGSGGVLVGYEDGVPVMARHDDSGTESWRKELSGATGDDFEQFAPTEDYIFVAYSGNLERWTWTTNGASMDLNSSSSTIFYDMEATRDNTFIANQTRFDTDLTEIWSSDYGTNVRAESIDPSGEVYVDSDPFEEYASDGATLNWTASIGGNAIVGAPTPTANSDAWVPEVYTSVDPVMGTASMRSPSALTIEQASASKIAGIASMRTGSVIRIRTEDATKVGALASMRVPSAESPTTYTPATKASALASMNTSSATWIVDENTASIVPTLTLTQANTVIGQGESSVLFNVFGNPLQIFDTATANTSGQKSQVLTTQTQLQATGNSTTSTITTKPVVTVLESDGVPPILKLDSVTTPVDVTIVDVDLNNNVAGDSQIITVAVRENTSIARRSGFDVDNSVNTVSDFVTAGTKATESDVQKVYTRQFGGESNL